MKPIINISLNPTYFCNLRCDFCYLTVDQLSDRNKLPLDRLECLLIELLDSYSIGTIDLYGGEVFLLKKKYLDDLINLLHKYNCKDINVITNLTTSHPMVSDPRLKIYVSYDMTARERHFETYINMLSIDRPFTILMLVTPDLLRHSVVEIVTYLNTIPNLEYVELKPYSGNQANSLDVSNQTFSDFVKDMIVIKDRMSFGLVNIHLLDEVISRNSNAYSDDHLYITPDGSYAVLDFDDLGNELFLHMDSLDQYNSWINRESEWVDAREDCEVCNYKGKCLSEHLRKTTPIDDTCDGFITLIDWYRVFK